MVFSRLGLGTMPERSADRKSKKDPTVAVKVRRETVGKLADVAEATGRHLHEVIDALVQPGLDAEWAAVQPKLKKIREQKARIAALQEEARKASEG